MAIWHVFVIVGVIAAAMAVAEAYAPFTIVKTAAKRVKQLAVRLIAAALIVAFAVSGGIAFSAQNARMVDIMWLSVIFGSLMLSATLWVVIGGKNEQARFELGGTVMVRVIFLFAGFLILCFKGVSAGSDGWAALGVLIIGLLSLVAIGTGIWMQYEMAQDWSSVKWHDMFLWELSWMWLYFGLLTIMGIHWEGILPVLRTISAMTLF